MKLLLGRSCRPTRYYIAAPLDDGDLELLLQVHLGLVHQDLMTRLLWIVVDLQERERERD
jgi:hypothetical protein